jgi:hypothetical protein
MQYASGLKLAAAAVAAVARKHSNAWQVQTLIAVQDIHHGKQNSTPGTLKGQDTLLPHTSQPKYCQCLHLPYSTKQYEQPHSPSE